MKYLKINFNVKFKCEIYIKEKKKHKLKAKYEKYILTIINNYNFL